MISSIKVHVRRYVLRIYSMIACLRLKLDLGGSKSKMRYVRRGDGGWVDRNVTFCYTGGKGVRNDRNQRYVIFGRAPKGMGGSKSRLLA